MSPVLLSPDDVPDHSESLLGQEIEGPTPGKLWAPGAGDDGGRPGGSGHVGEGDHVLRPGEAQVHPGAELGLSLELSVDRVREPGTGGQREHGLGAETPLTFVKLGSSKKYSNAHLHFPHKEDEKNGPCDALTDYFVTFVFFVQ